MPPLPANFQKAGEPMANKLLTDVELRANWSLHHQEDYAVEEGTILTPAAVDFLREHNIRLRYVVPERPGASMTRTPSLSGMERRAMCMLPPVGNCMKSRRR